LQQARDLPVEAFIAVSKAHPEYRAGFRLGLAPCQSGSKLSRPSAISFSRRIVPDGTAGGRRPMRSRRIEDKTVPDPR